MRAGPALRLALLALMVLAPGLLAQLQTGNLYGKVVGSEGEALAGAKLTLSGPGAPRVEATDAEGGFRFLGLAPGSYSLAAELDGFSIVEYPNIVIQVGRNTTIEVVLTPAVEKPASVPHGGAIGSCPTARAVPPTE